MSLMYGQDFNLLDSVVKNIVSNALAEMMGEPVDAVSGAYCITATDLTLPGLQGPVGLRRRYLSTVKQCGSMGKGWGFLYDSHLTRDGEKVHLDTITGHKLLFVRTEGGWQQETKGCGWFDITYQEKGQCWLLTDHKAHTLCHYKANGLLEVVEDQNRQATTFTYKDGMLSSLTTPLGHRMEFGAMSSLGTS